MTWRKTPDLFEDTLHAMCCKYIGAKAGDIQIENFKTLQKPIKTSALDHLSQMFTLAWYGNKLPDNELPPTNEQMKKCIFQSFPIVWQQ